MGIHKENSKAYDSFYLTELYFKGFYWDISNEYA